MITETIGSRDGLNCTTPADVDCTSCSFTASTRLALT
jgi:hypothetical protein